MGRMAIRLHEFWKKTFSTQRGIGRDLHAISEDLDKIYEGLRTMEYEAEEFRTLNESGRIKAIQGNFHSNQCVWIKEKGNDQKLICRYHVDKAELVPIQRFSEGVWGISSRNPEQEIALDRDGT